MFSVLLVTCSVFAQSKPNAGSQWHAANLLPSSSGVGKPFQSQAHPLGGVKSGAGVVHPLAAHSAEVNTINSTATGARNTAGTTTRPGPARQPKAAGKPSVQQTKAVHGRLP